MSSLRNKLRLYSVEQKQARDVLLSFARVKHLVGADNKKIDGMCNICDVPIKPSNDKFGDCDQLHEVVCERTSSPVERQINADILV